MASVVFPCDRCGKTVEGGFDTHFTMGYYNVAPGGAWEKFARAGEERICDYCMWADPEYKKIYGHDAEAAKWREENGL